MPSQIGFTIIDHSNQYSKVDFNIPDIDETVWVATNTKITALQAAVAALTTGNIAYKTLVAFRDEVDDTNPANPYAQRELGMRLYMKDTVTGKKFHATIPAPDLIVTGAVGTDDVDMTLSLVSPVIAAIEALVVSPEGNPVTIYRAKNIGRKSTKRRS